MERNLKLRKNLGPVGTSRTGTAVDDGEADHLLQGHFLGWNMGLAEIDGANFRADVEMGPCDGASPRLVPMERDKHTVVRRAKLEGVTGNASKPRF